MARRVYFAFDYKDVFKVNQIRRAGEFTGVARAGFADASQWEKLKRKQDAVTFGKFACALVHRFPAAHARSSRRSSVPARGTPMARFGWGEETAGTGGSLRRSASSKWSTASATADAARTARRRRRTAASLIRTSGQDESSPQGGRKIAPWTRAPWASSIRAWAA